MRDQITAYQKALYVVFGRPELVIRIGEPNPDLDELLEAEADLEKILTQRKKTAR